jgi:ABC-type transport system involved in multi-copper enzyme maturation permease subunit
MSEEFHPNGENAQSAPSGPITQFGVAPSSLPTPAHAEGNGSLNAASSGNAVPTVSPFKTDAAGRPLSSGAPLVQTVSWHHSGGDDHDTRAAWLRKFDDLTEWMSDWVNPILVKETRQALKSRQFTSTFGLMLVFALGATVLGVALQSPAIFYAPSGALLAILYYIVLLVPMLLVVPFQAFRSLAGEREEGTFDMLSVSTLQARQIVTGKLASAFSQMIVYYSALAPCLAFTYMLRGIDVIMIALFLGYLFIASTLFSAVALVLGSVTRTRYMQVVMSVAIVVLLLIGSFIFTYIMAGLFFDEIITRSYFETEFWYANLAMPMFVASFVALFVFVAAGQISFASDNRSTAVRIVMTVQHVLMASWLGGLLLEAPIGFLTDAIIASICAAFGYWSLMGVFLVAETNELSPRVKRDLPQTALSRAFFTLYNPGSGTGYFFVIAGATSILFCFAMLDCARSWGLVIPAGTQQNINAWPTAALRTTLSLGDKHVKFAILVWSYLVGYLGIGRLLILGGRRLFTVAPMVGVLVQLILILGSCLGCVSLAMLLSRRADADEYGPLQLPNWIWTLYEQGGSDGVPIEYVMIVAAFAVSIVAINAIEASREFLAVATQAPRRVRDEDREIKEAQTPFVPKNPWDKPIAASGPGEPDSSMPASSDAI